MASPSRQGPQVVHLGCLAQTPLLVLGKPAVEGHSVEDHRPAHPRSRYAVPQPPGAVCQGTGRNAQVCGRSTNPQTLGHALIPPTAPARRTPSAVIVRHRGACYTNVEQCGPYRKSVGFCHAARCSREQGSTEGLDVGE